MDCPHVPRIGLSELGAMLNEKIAGRRVPLSGTIELTSRCNLHCAQCYINRPASDGKAKRSELTKDQLCHLIDQIVDEECLWLLMTGGEPLIRSDLIDIYRHAKMKGLIVTLFTNGTCVDRRIADALAEWRPFSIEITLYGRTEKTYEAVTNVPGSFKRCMRGIDLLLERGLPLALKSTIVTGNKHEVWQMKSFAETLGVRFRFDPILIPRLDGKGSVEELRISPEEVVALDEADEDRLSEWLDFCGKFYGARPQSDRVFGCGAGIRTFHVDSEGRLTPCMLARSRSYDLRKGTFREGWHTFIAEVISERVGDAGGYPCRHCHLAPICGNCPGWAQLTGEQIGHPVDYVCKIAHLSFELFRRHFEAADVHHDAGERRAESQKEVRQA